MRTKDRSAVVTRLCALLVTAPFLLPGLLVADPPDDGVARSANFLVFAPPGDALAEQVLHSAERLRCEIALDWFGAELPAAERRTIIQVRPSYSEDEGLTMLTGDHAESRHRVWLTTQPRRARGTTLAHELTHVLMHSRFPHGMPAWANEGAASLQDDADRHARRRDLLSQFVCTGHWPSLQRLLGAPAITPTDERAYAVATSLTRFLLTQADRATFLNFVAAGQQVGWDAALRRHYAIDTTAELQRHWQQWVSRRLDVADARQG